MSFSHCQLLSSRLVVVAMLIVAISSNGYNLQSTAQCLTFDTTYNVCSKWSQSGTITPEDVDCFHGSTIVNQKEKGFIPMSELEEGDQISTFRNGQEQWSTVTGWLHKNEQMVAEYHRVKVNGGELMVSGKHNVAYSSENSYDYAFGEELQGKILYPVKAQVVSSDLVEEKGIYAPLTSLSSYLVYPNEQTPVLVHDYAHIRHPESYEVVVGYAMSLSEKIYGKGLNEHGINKSAQILMDTFSFLLE